MQGEAAGWRCRVLHAVPGRDRIEAPEWSPDEARVTVARLREHPDVERVRIGAGGHSLIIEHSAAAAIQDILETLPEAPSSPPDSGLPPSPPSTPFWRQLAIPTVALAAGISGAAPFSSLMVGTCAVPIARRAARSLSRHRLGIDVLDATAVSLLLGRGDVLAAGVSVALIETGERIRRRASGSARRVLRGWMGADARGVRVIEEGSEPRIAMAAVQPGDRAVVYAGETIPVDGIVIAGGASVDKRSWTGEPLSSAVTQGQQVLAGSLVSDGRLVIEVQAVGASTRAGRLAAALEDAIAANTRVSDMARRVADRFVVPTFIAGGLAFALTGDISRLISILIVDFGTGIRIAVPTAILTTMIAGARQNVLFRNGKAVEDLARVDTIVFDKTGTLTTGAPAVIGVITSADWEESGVLRLAAAAEGHLPHPIARALRRQARRRHLELPEPDSVRYHHGGGVQARIEGLEVLVGGADLLQRHGVHIPPATGSSVVLMAVDGAFAASFQLRDHLKPEAAAAVAALRNRGIRHIWLATGDRPEAARVVVRKLGLDGYNARMVPEEKVALVERLQSEGRVVALVGDGINDAAAMAHADVGIAVAEGAELARETADVVLSGEGLMSLVAAVQVAREGMSLVRQNIGVVGVTNGAALSVALTGGLSPLTATVLNNGSTLAAGLNALRPLRG